MKKLLLIPIILIVFLITTGFVTDTLPRISAGDDGTRISLWIPGFVVKIGSLFVGAEDPDAAMLLNKLGSARIYIEEGDRYKSTVSDYLEAIDEMKSDGCEELVRVSSVDANVFIGIRQDKEGMIRHINILVNEKDEAFVKMKLRCKMSLEDIAQFINDSEMDVIADLRDELPGEFTHNYQAGNFVIDQQL